MSNESIKGVMSLDRIKFILPNRTDSGCRKALREVFNLTNDEIFTASAHTTPIICRPSQFGRFIVLRNKYDGNNGIRNLKAELFDPTPKVEEYDVSKRKNTYNQY